MGVSGVTARFTLAVLISQCCAEPCIHMPTHHLGMKDFCTNIVFLLQLSVKGYNDKQHILLKKIIEKMATFEIDEKRFDIIKEAVSSAHILPLKPFPASA